MFIHHHSNLYIDPGLAPGRLLIALEKSLPGIEDEPLPFVHGVFFHESIKNRWRVETVDFEDWSGDFGFDVFEIIKPEIDVNSNVSSFYYSVVKSFNNLLTYFPVGVQLVLSYNNDSWLMRYDNITVGLHDF